MVPSLLLLPSESSVSVKKILIVKKVNTFINEERGYMFGVGPVNPDNSHYFSTGAYERVGA